MRISLVHPPRHPVPDPQDLLPAYEAFHEEYSTAEFSINRSKYVRYSPESVRAFIQDDLFEGTELYRIHNVFKYFAHCLSLTNLAISLLARQAARWILPSFISTRWML